VSEPAAERRPVEAPGPADFRDAVFRDELKRASIWIGAALAVVALWFLVQPILLIVGALVFAAMLDGGARLLGRVTRLGRGLRLAIVCIGVFAFLVWTCYFAGSELVAQFETLRVVVTNQLNRLFGWASSIGLITGPNQINEIGRQLMGSLGQLTAFVGNAFGALSSLAMIIVLGIFIAIEPRLYERGVAWMLPMESRGRFYETAGQMGRTLRLLMAGRLLGMGVEGVFTGIALAIAGIPMAALLGLLTGLLAFLPNIGAPLSGAIMILVGFSGGTDMGLYCIAVYVAVQTIDGNLIVPMVAKKTVDLAPALVLGAQLIMGALFGILGLALADPLVAMIKIWLERRSDRIARRAAESGAEGEAAPA